MSFWKVVLAATVANVITGVLFFVGANALFYLALSQLGGLK